VKSVNVRELKNNPSEALRLAREGVVVVLNRNKPDAVLVHLDDEKLLGMPGVRLALATALFRDGNLPLGRAARLAGLMTSEFAQHLSRQGIPVVTGNAEDVRRDSETLEEWLTPSS
jgi:prevent-host-death family protein